MVNEETDLHLGWACQCFRLARIAARVGARRTADELGGLGDEFIGMAIRHGAMRRRLPGMRQRGMSRAVDSRRACDMTFPGQPNCRGI